MELMEHIIPTEEQKDRIFEKAISGKQKQQSKFKVRYCVIAAALAMAIPTTIFADEIKEVFYNLLGKNEIVSEDVLTDIYSDDDGHVKITVKELLSDGINSYAIVEYSALDDKGKMWIDKAFIEENPENVNYHLNYPNLSPMFKDNNLAIYGVNYSYEAYELEKYHTENSRVFKVTCQASGNNFGTDCMQLEYNLPDKFRVKADINVSQSVQVKDIKIDSSNAPEKFYKPLGIQISPLSIAIYGKDLGIVESGRNSLGGYYQKAVNYEEVDSLYIFMKDGRKYDLIFFDEDSILDTGGAMTHVSNPDVEYDIVIYTGAFAEPLDISLIAGFELDGVYYPLTEKDLQN